MLSSREESRQRTTRKRLENAQEAMQGQVARIMQLFEQQSLERRTHIMTWIRVAIMTFVVAVGISLTLYVELEADRLLYESHMKLCMPDEQCFYESLVQKQTIRFKVRRVAQRYDQYVMECDLSSAPNQDCYGALAEAEGMVAYGGPIYKPFSSAHMLFSTSSPLLYVLPGGILRALTLNAVDLVPLLYVEFMFDDNDDRTVQLEGESTPEGQSVSHSIMPIVLQSSLAYSALVNAGITKQIIFLDANDMIPGSYSEPNRSFVLKDVFS